MFGPRVGVEAGTPHITAGVYGRWFSPGLLGQQPVSERRRHLRLQLRRRRPRALLPRRGAARLSPRRGRGVSAHPRRERRRAGRDGVGLRRSLRRGRLPAGLRPLLRGRVRGARIRGEAVEHRREPSGRNQRRLVRRGTTKARCTGRRRWSWASSSSRCRTFTARVHASPRCQFPAGENWNGYDTIASPPCAGAGNCQRLIAFATHISTAGAPSVELCTMDASTWPLPAIVNCATRRPSSFGWRDERLVVAVLHLVEVSAHDAADDLLVQRAAHRSRRRSRRRASSPDASPVARRHSRNPARSRARGPARRRPFRGRRCRACARPCRRRRRRCRRCPARSRRLLAMVVASMWPSTVSASGPSAGLSSRIAPSAPPRGPSSRARMLFFLISPSTSRASFG